MFKKCLKYDMAAYRKVWLIAAGAILLVSVFCGLGIGGLITATSEMAELTINEGEPSNAFMIGYMARMILGMGSYFTIIAALVLFGSATGILRIVHYYTTFFTDQGYLTFTLPVKRSTHFWSKVFSYFIYSLGYVGIGIVSIGNMLLGILASCLMSDVTRESVWLLLREISGISFNPYVIPLVLLLLVLFVVLIFAGVLMDYLIVTMAATLFRKLKIISVIAAYYVINNVIAVPVAYIGMYGLVFAVGTGVAGFTPLFSVPIIGWSGIYLLLVLAILGTLTVGLTAANFTVWRLERKLNLA